MVFASVVPDIPVCGAGFTSACLSVNVILKDLPSREFDFTVSLTLVLEGFFSSWPSFEFTSWANALPNSKATRENEINFFMGRLFNLKYKVKNQQIFMPASAFKTEILSAAEFSSN